VPTTRPSANNVDDYIAAFPPAVQALLREVRRVVRAAAPEAEECLSYRIPAYKQAGVVVYFAAFKGHLGLYPPVRGDAALVEAVARYAGPKGNLQFPYDEPLPLDLIERVTRARLQQNLAQKSAARKNAAQKAAAPKSSARKAAAPKSAGSTTTAKKTAARKTVSSAVSTRRS
jgi:uncharacterized protein YdhG (YjbR/CyaY superfamily)